ncbi:unnamed protein product, partial [Closterium sp. NIES-54]
YQHQRERSGRRQEQPTVRWPSRPGRCCCWEEWATVATSMTRGSLTCPLPRGTSCIHQSQPALPCWDHMCRWWSIRKKRKRRQQQRRQGRRVRRRRGSSRGRASPTRPPCCPTATPSHSLAAVGATSSHAATSCCCTSSAL